jgi:hypothetical protein
MKLDWFCLTVIQRLVCNEQSITISPTLIQKFYSRSNEWQPLKKWNSQSMPCRLILKFNGSKGLIGVKWTNIFLLQFFLEMLSRYRLVTPSREGYCHDKYFFPIRLCWWAILRLLGIVIKITTEKVPFID